MKAYETCKPVLLEQVQFKPVIVPKEKGKVKNGIIVKIWSRKADSPHS